MLETWVRVGERGLEFTLDNCQEEFISKAKADYSVLYLISMMKWGNTYNNSPHDISEQDLNKTCVFGYETDLIIW